MALAREDFADRLTKARLRKHLTQEELAQRIGVAPRQVIRWEGAHSMPYLSNIEKIAAALAIPSEELTGDDDAAFSLRLRELPYRIARIEAMLELLLDHQGIIPKDGQLPPPPAELADILQPATPAKRRRRNATPS